MDTTTTRRNLEKAAVILEHRGWVRKSFAVDKHGNNVHYTSPNADKFCLSGAIHRASENEMAYSVADAALSKQINHDYGTYNIVQWNDELARDRRQVVRLIRRTARNLAREVDYE